MIYLILAVYFALGYSLAFSFVRVNTFYFGKAKGDRGLASLIGVFWFFGWPTFLWSYRKEIKSVVRGRDWADDNLEEDVRDEFRATFHEAN